MTGGAFGFVVWLVGKKVAAIAGFVAVGSDKFAHGRFPRSSGVVGGRPSVGSPSSSRTRL